MKWNLESIVMIILLCAFVSSLFVEQIFGFQSPEALTTITSLFVTFLFGKKYGEVKIYGI